MLDTVVQKPEMHHWRMFLLESGLQVLVTQIIYGKQ